MRARLLLLAAALAAFGGSLFAGFHVDDYAIFPVVLSPQWWRGPHPLTTLTFWLNDRLGGQEAWGYHAFNLVLHLAAVLLAFECLRRLLPPAAALAAAAIFAVHPLQAEAVNYVSERGMMLAALLCFTALLAWIEGQPWWSVAAFAAALLADPRCALFPVLLPWVRRTGQSLGRTVAIVVCLALAIAATAHQPAGAYVLARTTLRFLRLIVVPWGFTIAPHEAEPIWIAALAAAAIVATVLWRWRRLEPRSEYAWLLAGLLLAIPHFSGNPAADSRAYLAMFAFAAAAGLLLARLPARGVAAAVVAILCVIGISRTYVWMSDERLWREAVRRAPGDVGAKLQLAKSLKAADALELLGRARQQAPYNAEIPALIGKVLLDEQQFDGALDELSHAVALNPRNALAFNNRGVALAALGQTEAAMADFQHALVLDPGLAEAQENLKRLSGKY